MLIALSGNSTCPVGILQRYISATTEPSLSNNYLFRPIKCKEASLNVVTDVSVFRECIVFVQVVPQRLQMQEYRIDTLSIMDAGDLRLLRMVMLRIH